MIFGYATKALSRKAAQRKNLVNLRASVSWWHFYFSCHKGSKSQSCTKKKLSEPSCLRVLVATSILLATEAQSRKAAQIKNLVNLRASVSRWLLLFYLPQRLKDSIPIAIGTQIKILVNLCASVSSWLLLFFLPQRR